MPTPAGSMPSTRKPAVKPSPMLARVISLDGPWTPMTPQTPPPEKLASVPFGCSSNKLEIFEEIGNGTTSTVFRGKFNGKPAAIKQINSSACFTGLLRNELSILKSLNHPNVVRLLSTVQDRTKAQIITELCEGGDVFHLLHVNDHVEISWKQAIKIACDTAQGMEYMHGLSPPIMHGDLKSLNLLLMHAVQSAEDGCIVKVADFGCAAQDNRTDHVSRKGTFNWMAPEVFGNDRYDIRADVFSFGMVLFELIYREVPFEDVEPSKISSFVLNGERPNLEGMPPDCPELLQHLMRRCWAQLPEDRPSFVEVCDSLLIEPPDSMTCWL